MRAGRQDQSQKKGRQGNRLTVVANEKSAPADPGRLAAVMKYVIWVETVLAETAKDFHLIQECKDRVAELQSRLSPRAAPVEPSRVSGPMDRGTDFASGSPPSPFEGGPSADSH